MSDRMTPIPFHKLVEWILKEKKEKNSVFGVKKAYSYDGDTKRTMFGRSLETPIGPAAGPHTQLAQNLVTSYYGGSRFFELKTVQILDGEDLPVSKPCILADDECYNCEWSTELYVPEAYEEYVKGWFLLAILAKEYGLGSIDGYQFNMSVGYDLEGIKSEKINTFIDGMINATNSEIFQACKKYLIENIDQFENLTKEDVEGISPYICNSATLSTLHGCPPQEIERIATYLIEEKGLNTFIKCNPTLLGYEYARKTMDEMGYDYVAFGDFHFKDDLQYEDAVPMLKRLLALSESKKLDFGVKITNTFPVDVKQNELPSEEMYMSGKSLYALSMSVAQMLTRDFDGKLRISYSGGADAFNIKDIVASGIWPVTVATTLLKVGGYQRLIQLANETVNECITFEKVDMEAVNKLVEEGKKSKYHVKSIKPLPTRKVNKQVPLTDCFFASCKEGCPIHQDITPYLELVGQKKYTEALAIITEKNPLPFITGTICNHECMSKCSRNFYEDPIGIRDAKLEAANGGFETLMKELKEKSASTGKKVAVVGGGPAGMAATFFLSRAGHEVTLYEKRANLGGVVRHVIPEFRIPRTSIEADEQLIQAYGATVVLNKEITDLEALKKENDYVVLAVGAYKQGNITVENANVLNAISFLEDYNRTEGNLELGKHVVVIGAGNTAMDTARAAKKNKGVDKVSIVYRRTKRYMPADEEELVLALEDGVELKELLAPIRLEGNKLLCDVMQLDAMDASGRRGVSKTGETTYVDADTMIAAVGEQVPTEFYESLGINVNERGIPKLNQETLETSVSGVYLVGDGKSGPLTVVQGIADAKKAAEAISGKTLFVDYKENSTLEEIYDRRGPLVKDGDDSAINRCLSCATVCENCVEVCPNRANVSVVVDGVEQHQILHVDYMCNECGNCKSFCPYDSAPYLHKFTLFANEKDLMDSSNDGFTITSVEEKAYIVRYLGEVKNWKSGTDSNIPETLRKVMDHVCESDSWLVL